MSVAAKPDSVAVTAVGMPAIAVSWPPVRNLRPVTPILPPTESTELLLIETEPLPVMLLASVSVPPFALSEP